MGMALSVAGSKIICAYRWLMVAYDKCFNLIGLDMTQPWEVKANNDVPGGPPFVMLDLDLKPQWEGWTHGERGYKDLRRYGKAHLESELRSALLCSI